MRLSRICLPCLYLRPTLSHLLPLFIQTLVYKLYLYIKAHRSIIYVYEEKWARDAVRIIEN